MDIQKESEIRLHKKLVEQYKIRHGGDYAIIYHEFWNSEIVKGLPLQKDLYVLDCGCGNGILLSYLIERFKNVFGLDLSIELASSNCLKNKNFKGLVIGDIERLPFTDGGFDVVICRSSLHHLPHPREAIKEIYDKLKPGGFFVLSEPCNDSLILRLPRKIFREKSTRFTIGHKAFGSKDIKEMLCDCGFSINSSRKFGLVAFPLCGLSDFLPIMRFLIFRKTLTRLLIFFDKLCSRVPLIKAQCWHIMIRSQK